MPEMPVVLGSQANARSIARPRWAAAPELGGAMTEPTLAGPTPMLAIVAANA